MKDICGNEIKAGDICHIWWPDNDCICTAVRTRGRGIKFVTDDEKTLTTDFLIEHEAQVAIQGSQQRAKKDDQAVAGGVTTDELEMIEKLRKLGWYGTLYKKSLLLSTFRIEMPELETK